MGKEKSRFYVMVYCDTSRIACGYFESNCESLEDVLNKKIVTLYNTYQLATKKDGTPVWVPLKSDKMGFKSRIILQTSRLEVVELRESSELVDIIKNGPKQIVTSQKTLIGPTGKKLTSA